MWYRNKGFGLFSQMARGLFIVYQYVASLCFPTVSLEEDSILEIYVKIEYIVIYCYAFFNREQVLLVQLLECTLSSLKQMSLSMTLMLKLP